MDTTQFTTDTKKGALLTGAFFNKNTAIETYTPHCHENIVTLLH